MGKKGLPDALNAIRAAHPDKRIELWFEDEARVGQKGRTCHVWWLRGQRPPGLADKRFSFAYVFAAVQPATGRSACLVLPEVSTEAMQAFLDSFSATLAANVHAALVVDGAGWHTSLALCVPDNVTLVPLLVVVNSSSCRPIISRLRSRIRTRNQLISRFATRVLQHQS